jgi:hypothetical protein
MWPSLLEMLIAIAKVCKFLQESITRLSRPGYGTRGTFNKDRCCLDALAERAFAVELLIEN